VTFAFSPDLKRTQSLINWIQQCPSLLRQLGISHIPPQQRVQRAHHHDSPPRHQHKLLPPHQRLPIRRHPHNRSKQHFPPFSSLLRETEEHDNVEDANLPGSLPSLRRPAINFSKLQEEDLPARIERLWYINPYGHEMSCPANPRVLDALNNSSTVIYSIGSLFTSIIPSIILRGIGNAIASPSVRNKILLLNSSIDRETGPSATPFTALDFVAAIGNACAESRGLQKPKKEELQLYVTHIVYLECKEAPKVDREELAKVGIEAIRLYGLSGRYDDRALEQALKMMLGKGEQGSGLSRRNTLQR
jgi:hypothetical protein